MGSLIPLARRTELAPSQQGPLATAPHQLDLVLDDVRLRGMTQGERCSGSEDAGSSAARGHRHGNAGGRR